MIPSQNGMHDGVIAGGASGALRPGWDAPIDQAGGALMLSKDRRKDRRKNDGAFTRLAYRAVAIDAAFDLHDRIVGSLTSAHFSSHALATMGIDLETPAGFDELVPKSGPLVVVCNHPFGAVDGLAAVALLEQRRPDVKVLANHLLGNLPGYRRYLLPLDVLSASPEARARNIASLRAAMAWLKEGHALVLFPAGEVAHFHLKARRVVESPWSHHAARLARGTGASVLPLYFAGSNRKRFHAAGLVHPRLRTALLVREMLARQQRPLEVRASGLMSPRKVKKFNSDEDLTRYLRLRCFAMASGERKPISQTRRAGEGQPVARPKPKALVAQELAALPASAKLLTAAEYDVFYAHAQEIPNTLHEIGRLREETFRAVDEGTGKRLDLDEYDAYYTHLFVWNRDEQALVGAYRLGRVDDIVARYGLEGLYTHSLFAFRADLIERIDPALELGRSFVAAPYQRSPQGLFLLWRGIGAFLSRYPYYRHLFGPVTISPSYEATSKALLVSFLTTKLRDEALSKLAAPRNPFSSRQRIEPELADAGKVIDDISLLSELIANIEPDRKRAPVLIEQYVRLGGRFLQVSVDRDFNNAIDALVLVNLDKTSPELLARYMGQDAARTFAAARNL